ncbi:DUF58 domain-containing protein [Rhodopirellula sp. MGV]|uniref:DUF58 domain-containing protein n=1 Tax=Rhodopirellula sp. MGV TaxID=2023130 RepID=UPI000B9780B7|nr:DUF58 domain-containing protein [Rhodopirellula sp. MGV]OYP35448.1 hypothetical protein CGZ80_11440 [Rhodopirellula sp. MGV]PNY33888.1 DUF58 domain-containing protein [Rhodopirellula baltica]
MSVDATGESSDRTGTSVGYSGPRTTLSERIGQDLNDADFRYQLRQSVRNTVYWLAAPFRGYMALRGSMTYASVFALLGVFMTLNVIWGFPWSGMMGAFFAILFVGFGINRIMRPVLRLNVTLPRVAIAGEPFSLSVRLTNSRVLPAINLRVGFQREGLSFISRSALLQHWDASPPVSVQILRSGEQMQWHGSMRFDTRGVHDLPPFHLASTFPFHLFYARNKIECETKIAITPVPANPNDDPTSRMMLAEIGDWTQQLVAGAPVEYIGNREYQVGVPVRRWDFASWARLGRPIVREYQSPSIQAITLIVDTSQRAAAKPQAARENAVMTDEQRRFERLMSIATTAINEISNRRVQLTLHVTNQPDQDAYQNIQTANETSDSMLIRLAAAKPTPPAAAQAEIVETLEACRRRPVLILSLIELDDPERQELAEQLPSSAKYLLIEDQPSTSSNPTKKSHSADRRLD